MIYIHTLKSRRYLIGLFFFVLISLIFFGGVRSASAAYITSWTSPVTSGVYFSNQAVPITGTWYYFSGGQLLRMIAYSIDGTNWTTCANNIWDGSNTSGAFSCSGMFPPGVHVLRLMAVGATGLPVGGASIYYETYLRTITVYAPGSGPVPTVMTLSAGNITSSSATLNGYADLRGLSSGMGWFRYDTNPANLNCAADSGGTRSADYVFIDPFAAFGLGLPPQTTYSYNISISGLSVGTTYYYCAIAASANGRGNGTIGSFTPAPPPPTVQTIGYTIVDSSNATLRARANPQGNESIGWFRYGTTNPGFSCLDTFGTRVPASGGTALGSGTSLVDYSIPISSLTLGTRYYYCAIASNSVGTGRGSVLSFTMALSNLLSENLMLANGLLIEGQNVRFRATVRNSSTVSTGASFSNSFTYRWGSSGLWIPLSTRIESPMNSGSSRTHTSNPLPLSSGGTLQVQYCTDDTFQIGELDEADNCITQTFTVTGITPPPPLLSTPELSATGRIVTEGSTVALSWDTNNGDETLCTLSGGTISTNPLTPTSGDAETGTTDVTVLAKTTYTLSCPHGSNSVTIEIVPRGFET